MRVAVLSFHSSPLDEPGSGDAGGMTVYVRCLARALAQAGVSTDIFTRATGAVRAPVVVSPGVRVVPIVAGPEATVPKEELQAHAAAFIAGIRAFASTQRVAYDVVHSHYWQSGLAAMALKDAWGIPFVHSPHTLGRVKNRFLAPGDSPEPRLRISGEDAITAAADVVIASTEDELAQLGCLYGVSYDRLKMLHPGVDHHVFRPLDRDLARRGLGLRDQAVMLFVGRIQPLKGIDLAIAALEELVPALDRDAVLLIVGGASGRNGGDEIARLRRLARELGVESSIVFAGPQAHDRLPVFYSAADVVTVCSHSESFGFAALEAHACGVPVVGTAVGGLSHIVRDGRSGFLLDSRDPAVFAARLKTLLSDDDLRAAFARQGVVSASSFSWEHAADSFLELYECLLRNDHPEICTC